MIHDAVKLNYLKSSNVLQGVGEFSDNEPLPSNEDGSELVDLKYIHWGYLNCCPTLLNKKKIKKEVWSTCWVELCGSTLRLYRDDSIPHDSSLRPPPRDFNGFPENLSKVGVFEIGGGIIDILGDFQGLKHRMRSKSIYSKVIRRHAFKVVFVKTNSAYIFQASSQSALLRWVSKFQEAVDAIADNKMSHYAEERLRLAQDIIMRSKSISEQSSVSVSTKASSEDLAEVVTNEPNPVNFRLNELKKLRSELRELVWQIEQQTINFLGSKGTFKRQEFDCQTKQDYLLIAGRKQTYIPKGTEAKIFGQLPNGRWRCYIEMNALLKQMNELLQSKRNGSVEEKPLRYSYAEENIPKYPLLGSLPSSIIPIPDCRDLNSGTPLPQNGVDIIEEYDETVTAEPYNTHRRYSRSAPMKSWTTSSPIQHSDQTAATESDSLESDEGSGDELPTGDLTSVFLRNPNNSGFIIRGKLRQKGISIIIGSSSSEDEDDDDDVFGGKQQFTNQLYRGKNPFRLSSQQSTIEEEEDSNGRQQNSKYIRYKQKKPLKQSFSLSEINNNEQRCTTDTDLLRQYGESDIRLHSDLPENVLRALDSRIGPDVKPPRNVRRTLLLHKKDERGYGFWLQTFTFTEKHGELQRRTFVRHVEDEGPAYMAGLREGDVIVEVENNDVTEKDHVTIVNLISDSKDKLRLVVKFTDAVRKVELAVKLKKRKALLKTKMEELEKIKSQEASLLRGEGVPESDEYSSITRQSSTDIREEKTTGVISSLSTSTESGLSSISTSSDELVVRTSKFEKESPEVLDSIKELSCGDNFLQASDDPQPTSNYVTTEYDLLRGFSSSIDYNTAIAPIFNNTPQGFNRSDLTRKGLRRAETMPVQRDIRNIFPKHEVVISLDNEQLKKLDSQSRKISVDSLYSDNSDSSDANSSPHSESKLSRNTRPASYKMAVKWQLKPKCEVNNV